MAEVKQYTVSLKEVAQLVLRREGIRKGKWVAGVNFGIQVGNFAAPADKTAKPAAMIIIDGFSLTRLPDGQAAPNEMADIVVDAAADTEEK